MVRDKVTSSKKTVPMQHQRNYSEFRREDTPEQVGNWYRYLQGVMHSAVRCLTDVTALGPSVV